MFNPLSVGNHGQKLENQNPLKDTLNRIKASGESPSGILNDALSKNRGWNEMPYILDDNLPDMKPCPFCGREPALQIDKRYPKMTRGSALPVDAYTVVCNTFS